MGRGGGRREDAPFLYAAADPSSAAEKARWVQCDEGIHGSIGKLAIDDESSIRVAILPSKRFWLRVICPVNPETALPVRPRDRKIGRLVP
ncbi:hypothetical protein COL27_30455, partial [Bacillus sp. AFS075960]